jgi:hypothetical protein
LFSIASQISCKDNQKDIKLHDEFTIVVDDYILTFTSWHGLVCLVGSSQAYIFLISPVIVGSDFIYLFNIERDFRPLGKKTTKNETNRASQKMKNLTDHHQRV